MRLKHLEGHTVCYVVSAYAPQIDREDLEKEDLYNRLEDTILSTPD